ncbi:hypothetical protein HK405_000905 [Cladochytrium tenue]|nr:hypothetical protein HK405_000905 [Cladochytrium tenue]
MSIGSVITSANEASGRDTAADVNANIDAMLQDLKSMWTATEPSERSLQLQSVKPDSEQPVDVSSYFGTEAGSASARSGASVRGNVVEARETTSMDSGPLTPSTTKTPTIAHAQMHNLQVVTNGTFTTLGVLTNTPGNYFGDIEKLESSGQGVQPTWMPYYFVVAGPTVHLFKRENSPEDVPLGTIHLLGESAATQASVSNTGAGMFVISAGVTPLLGSKPRFKPWVLRATSEDEAEAWVTIVQASLQLALAQSALQGNIKVTSSAEHPMASPAPTIASTDPSSYGGDSLGGRPPPPPLPTYYQSPYGGAYNSAQSQPIFYPLNASGPIRPTGRRLSDTSLQSSRVAMGSPSSRAQISMDESSIFSGNTGNSEKSSTGSFDIKKVFNIKTSRANGSAAGDTTDSQYVYLVRAGARQPQPKPPRVATATSRTTESVMAESTHSGSSGGAVGAPALGLATLEVRSPGALEEPQPYAPKTTVVVLSRAPEPAPQPRKNTQVYMVRGGAIFNAKPDTSRLVKGTNVEGQSTTSSDTPGTSPTYSTSPKSDKPSKGQKVYMVRGGSRRT